MLRKYFYSAMCLIGLLIPYYFLSQFIATKGLDGRALFRDLFSTHISAFFAVDLLLSCVVFVRFVRQEARQYSMPHQWMYFLALVLVGLSFALPLFLLGREHHLPRQGTAT